MDGNVEHMVELVSGIVVVGISVIWSYVSKTPLNATWWEALKTFGDACARQLITVIAGLAAVDPALLMNGQTSTSAFLLIILNLFLSARQSPDGSTGKGKPPIKQPE